MWPSRIARTIAWEITTIFFVSLVALTTLMMFIGVAREAIRQGLAPMAVAQMIPYALPNALVFAIPGTVLFSICCVYGRMSADREISAIASTGISPVAIVRPAIVIAAIMSLVTVGLIDLAFTWGYLGVQRIVLQSVEHVAYNVLNRNHNFHRDGFSICVQDVVGERLLQPRILFDKSDGAKVTIEAAESTLSVSKDGCFLLLSLTNGVVDFGDGTAFQFTDKFEYAAKIATEESADLLHANPSHMPLPSIGPAQTAQVSDIRKKESELAVQVGFDLLSARFDFVKNQTFTDRIHGLKSSRDRLHRLGTESARRWATGFTCLAFAIVGIPVAILLQSSDFMTIFGICFLPILIVYYPIFALSLDLAKEGVVPPIFVWLPNCLALSLAIPLMRKALYA